MVAGEDFTASKGPGGKAARLLDSVVAFVVAIFHPIFRVLVSVVSPSKSSASASQSQPRDPQHAHEPSCDANQSEVHNQHPRQTPANNDGDIDVSPPTEITTNNRAHMQNGNSFFKSEYDTQKMPASLQNRDQAMAPAKPLGQRVANTVVIATDSNGQPESASKATAPRTTCDSVNGGLKQENRMDKGVGATAVNNAHDPSPTNATNVLFRDVGDEQAEEDRQEQLTLPPPVQPVNKHVEDDDDPVKAAERAVHLGFMNQALDMVRSLLTFLAPTGTLSCNHPLSFLAGAQWLM